jgi:uncharacterized membrane protein YqhA
MSQGEAGREPSAPGAPGVGPLEWLLKIRYVAVLVVILAVMHSLTFLAIATRIAVSTYWNVFTNSHGDAEHRPGLELLHSLDLLLVSLVLMILGIGVAKLFLLSPAMAQRSSRLPGWLDVVTFSELKFLLWETILTTLLVVALTSFIPGMADQLSWGSLVMPVAILLLALSLYFMRKH